MSETIQHKVSIVVCWQTGTDDMVPACLNSIYKHTHDVNYEIVLVTRCDPDEPYVPYFRSTTKIPFHHTQVREIQVPLVVTGSSSHVHGKLLDAVIPSGIGSEYVMTLDSDCFPVADGWMTELLGKIESGAKIAGILHPWAPPPDDMPHNKIEWRVRSQHCWNSTHVACQMMKTTDFLELHAAGCRYNAGDDTGLTFPKAALARGWKIDGFKASRCALPFLGREKLPVEYNRYSCLVFGDKVYHHGGFSRVHICKDDPVFGNGFDWCERLVLWGHGAEFLLSDDFSWRFTFQMEEAVAAEKMQRLFGLEKDRMKFNG